MNKLWSAQETADFLGVKLSTIYSWTHMERIPFIKVGGLLRFRETDILEWIEDHKRSTKKYDFN